ncbi:MAG: hypothetical protein QXI42_08385 [Thermoproteota archaeon]|nr:hypothetical protein [Candidatus Brockarchaeota archaeon]
MRIIIEGKKPGKWDELVRECEERLDNNICDLCVMVEYLDVRTGKIYDFTMPDQRSIKEALVRGRFNVGFLSYIDRAGLGRWIGVKSEPEQYKNVGFDELLTYLMSAYSRVVKEDIIEPVVERMEDVLREFSNNVLMAINLERLKEVLELRGKEEEE